MRCFVFLVNRPFAGLSGVVIPAIVAVVGTVVVIVASIHVYDFGRSVIILEGADAVLLNRSGGDGVPVRVDIDLIVGGVGIDIDDDLAVI